MREETVRVLQVLGILDRGGAETMIMNLYRAMDREKIQFDFIVHTDKPGAYDAEVESLGGRIYHAPKYRGSNHFEYRKWWERFFMGHPEYSIIHSHIRSTASVFLAIAKRHGRITIIHSHSTSNGKGIAALAKSVLQSRVTRYADFLFACSDEAGRWLFGPKAIKRNNYYILKNSIKVSDYIFDAEERARVRDEFGLRDYFVMGTVGNISEPKNPYGIIRIIRGVCAELPEARFLWVGNADRLPEVKQKVQSSDLKDNVVFTGVRKDIPALLAAMDIFVFPSLWEGLGLAAIEAQASGLQCLISDTITKEVCVTPYISQLPARDVDMWVLKILEAQRNPIREHDPSEYLFKSGYDVSGNAMWLQAFYLKCGAAEK